MNNTFIIPASTGTYADTLTALGLAQLIHAVLEEDVQLERDTLSGGLHVIAPRPLEDVTELDFKPLFKAIRTKGEPGTGIQYEQEKARRTAFFEWRKNHSNVKLTDLPPDQLPPSFRDDYSLISSLVDLLKPVAGSTYNKTADLLERGDFGIYAQTALEVFGELDGTPDTALARLKARFGKRKAELSTSAVMVFNPMAGKGMNAVKPNSIGMGGADAPIPLEMLKFSGWWLGAVAATPKKSKDLKVLVVVPNRIARLTLETVMTRFRKRFFGGGAVQIDILAALHLTDTLLEYHAEQPEDLFVPREVLDGFQVAYFSNLGSAKGVTNLSYIGLPSWVRVEQPDDVQAWREVLLEHRLIVGRLDESHTEAYRLLEQYRDFVSGGRLEALLEFLIDYGVYALARADKGQPVSWFGTEGLRRIFMAMDEGQNKLSDIVDNPGFQNIAAAIRRATRGALYARKPPIIKGKAPKQPDRTFDVHYGLAQDLKRKALYPTEFAAAISDFVTEYMTENLRAVDRGKKSRPAVTTEDLAQLMQLLDRPDHHTVAMMLIAYGYARAPYDAESPLENSDGADDSDEGGSDVQNDLQGDDNE